MKKLIIFLTAFQCLYSYAKEHRSVLFKRTVSVGYLPDSYYAKLVITEDSLFIESKRKSEKRNISLSLNEIKDIKKGFPPYFPVKLTIINKNGTKVRIDTWHRRKIFKIIKAKIMS